MAKFSAANYGQLLLNGVDNFTAMKTSLYEVKHIPLREYQKQLWRNPAYRLDEKLGRFA